MTPEQLTFIKTQYGGLIENISTKVSGDCTISKEDIQQELYIASGDAISGFERQNNGSNGSWEDFKSSKGFGQYLKTVLWHKKAKLGKAITDNSKRIPSNSSLDFEKLDGTSLINIEDKYIPNNSFTGINDLSVILSNREQEIVDYIVNDYSKFTINGKINVLSLSKKIGINPITTKKLIKSIENKYTEYLQSN